MKMQKIKCWIVRERFGCGEDEIYYFNNYKLAKEYYDHEDDNWRPYGGAFTIYLDEEEIEIHDEKFW